MSDVPEGYKMSEVGVIPEEWEVKSFGEICTVNQGLQIAIKDRLNHPVDNSKIYITIQYLNNGKDIEYINNYSDSVCCAEEDVLMTRTGNTGMVVTGVNGVFHNNFFKINLDKKQVDRAYVIYYLKANKTQRIILLKAGTSTIPDLNHNDFYSIRIPLPPLPEQQAIASALSDVDALVTALEQLITKKRNIKKGAMQQLLTGKKRLPGFGGEWEVVPFKEIFKKHSTNNYQIKSSEYQQSGTYPIIDQGKQKVVAYSDNKEKLFRCPTKGVIIFGDHTREFKFINFNFVIGADGTQVLSTGEEFSEMFYYYQLLNKEIPNTGYNRHFKFLLEMFFITPKLPEQKAIAQILSDMDTEVESLEQKRDKYKAIKQGMMQELLTGKRRLLA